MSAECDHLGPALHLSDDAARVLHVGLAAGQEGLRAKTPTAGGGGMVSPVVRGWRQGQGRGADVTLKELLARARHFM